MGMESVIYGFIQGPWWPKQFPDKDALISEHSEMQRMYMEKDRKLTEKVHHNLQAISMLPEEDTWPFLSRSMFSSSSNSFQTTYRSQIIHFGASFKQIEMDWEEWLRKFEALLRNLYWDEVHLHLITEWMSPQYYIWKTEDLWTIPARWTRELFCD